MGKCIINSYGVSFNGGETKDAKPPGVGGGHGRGGGEGLFATVFSANALILLFLRSIYLKGYLGNRVSNGFP